MISSIYWLSWLYCELKTELNVVWRWMQAQKVLGAGRSDLCPGSWVAAVARRPQVRSWGRWKRCTSGWWTRCRTDAAVCLFGWWSLAGRACRGGRCWRSGRSSEASASGPSWWDSAEEGQTTHETELTSAWETAFALLFFTADIKTWQTRDLKPT